MKKGKEIGFLRLGTLQTKFYECDGVYFCTVNLQGIRIAKLSALSVEELQSHYQFELMECAFMKIRKGEASITIEDVFNKLSEKKHLTEGDLIDGVIKQSYLVENDDDAYCDYNPRAGWDESFRKAKENGEFAEYDEIPDILDDDEFEEY